MTSSFRASPRRALRQSMPPAVRRVLPAYAWTIERLWALSTPPRNLAVADVAWLLEVPIWRWRGHRFQVAPRAVLADPIGFAAHFDKAMATDLSYPIHATHHRGRLVVLDGYHRLLKTVVLGQPTIKAIEVTRADLKRWNNATEPRTRKMHHLHD